MALPTFGGCQWQRACLIDSLGPQQRISTPTLNSGTHNPSVNSRNDRKSTCRIWCRLREIGSHFSFFSCTHTCTDASGGWENDTSKGAKGTY